MILTRPVKQENLIPEALHFGVYCILSNVLSMQKKVLRKSGMAVSGFGKKLEAGVTMCLTELPKSKFLDQNILRGQNMLRMLKRPDIHLD